jgi:arylsulfatase
MDAALRPVLARQMEIYAAFLAHTDFHVGRLIDALDTLSVLDDTLIYYILGDNGASAEGTPNGTFNEFISLNGMAQVETAEMMASRIDEFGTPTAYNHYAVSWAHAMCTPYQWTKQIASHLGGTRNGTIVHWPSGFTARGQTRGQFHHVIDVVPTVLEAAGLPEPDFVNGIQQRPMEGVSMRYCFDDPDAAERRETQYFEMFCNRGIYHKGWMAVTRHSNPWELGAELPAFDEDVWELYDLTTDWTQARDLAARMPDKLRQLQRQFLIEAAKYNVFPLDDRREERFNSDLAGRPVLVTGPSQVLYRNMGRLSEDSVLNVKNKSHTVTAEIEVGDRPANGVIIAQGGAFGGWVLYAKDGVPRYCYNLFGLARYTVTGDARLTAGTHLLRMDFGYDGGGLAKGGTVTLDLDGTKIGEGRVDATVPMIFSSETTDLGRDAGSAVSDDYTPEDSVFTGTVNWVELDIGPDSHDHLIRPQDRLRAAVTRQ